MPSLPLNTGLTRLGMHSRYVVVAVLDGRFFLARGKEVTNLLNDLLIGVLVAGAYIAPGVLFALAIRPAGDAVQSVGRSAASL
jgi:hypothetical protein